MSDKNLENVEEVSNIYSQLGSCCTLISSLQERKQKDKDEFLFHMRHHLGGWDIHASTIKSAGISKEEVYNFIHDMALAKKHELETRLKKIDEALTNEQV